MQSGTDADSTENTSLLTDMTESSGCVCPTQQSCITDGRTSCSPSCCDCLHIESSMTHSDGSCSSSSSRPFYLHPPASSSSSCGTVPPNYIQRADYSDIYNGSSQQGFFLNPIKTTTVQLENHKNQINTTHSWVGIHVIICMDVINIIQSQINCCSRILVNRSTCTTPVLLFTIASANYSPSRYTRGLLPQMLPILKPPPQSPAPSAIVLLKWTRTPPSLPSPLLPPLLLPPPPPLPLLPPHPMRIYLR